MNSEISKLKALQDDLNHQIGKAGEGREEGPERLDLLRRLTEVEAQNQQLKEELERLKDLDPDMFDEKKAEVKGLKEMGNRWTDNIFTLQSYCSNQFNISRQDFNSQFNIPEELDYVE